ncbi:TonB family protein [bacterium]|nr:TonB family protein [bacterium]
MREALKKSLWLHALLVGPVTVLVVLQSMVRVPVLDKVEFEVIEKTISSDKKIVKIEEQEVNSVKQNEKQERIFEQPVKEVFGLQKDTLLDEGSNADNTVSIKKGNTVLKEQDNEIAENDDPLPVPKPEYMVTQMPILIKKVTPVYPKKAKDSGFETTVELNVLIDEKGIVRLVKLVDDPGMGIGQAAIEAMRQFKFKPAKIAGKPVAVEIRYEIEFEINS